MRRESDHRRVRRRTGPRNVDIHDDGCHSIDAMRSALGTLHGALVVHMARKFHDSVMNFDADRAGNHILFLPKLGEDVVFDLNIVCHRPIPSSKKSVTVLVAFTAVMPRVFVIVAMVFAIVASFVRRQHAPQNEAHQPD
jgi:hypothetical protein